MADAEEPVPPEMQAMLDFGHCVTIAEKHNVSFEFARRFVVNSTWRAGTDQTAGLDCLYRVALHLTSFMSKEQFKEFEEAWGKTGHPSLHKIAKARENSDEVKFKLETLHSLGHEQPSFKDLADDEQMQSVWGLDMFTLHMPILFKPVVSRDDPDAQWTQQCHTPEQQMLRFAPDKAGGQTLSSFLQGQFGISTARATNGTEVVVLRRSKQPKFIRVLYTPPSEAGIAVDESRTPWSYFHLRKLNLEVEDVRSAPEVGDDAVVLAPIKDKWDEPVHETYTLVAVVKMRSSTRNDEIDMVKVHGTDGIPRGPGYSRAEKSAEWSLRSPSQDSQYLLYYVRRYEPERASIPRHYSACPECPESLEAGFQRQRFHENMILLVETSDKRPKTNEQPRDNEEVEIATEGDGHGQAVSKRPPTQEPQSSTSRPPKRMKESMKEDSAAVRTPIRGRPGDEDPFGRTEPRTNSSKKRGNAKH